MLAWESMVPVLPLSLEMKESHFEHGDITLFSIFLACGHASLVKQGKMLYVQGKVIRRACHAVAPRMKHSLYIIPSWNFVAIL